MAELPQPSAARIEFARCDGAARAANECLLAASDAADFVDLRHRMLAIVEKWSDEMGKAADGLLLEAMEDSDGS